MKTILRNTAGKTWVQLLLFAFIIVAMFILAINYKHAFLHENGGWISGIITEYDTSPPIINWIIDEDKKLDGNPKEEIRQAIKYTYTEIGFPEKITVSGRPYTVSNVTEAYLAHDGDTTFYKVAMNNDTLYVSAIPPTPRSTTGIWSLDSVIKDKLTDQFVELENK